MSRTAVCPRPTRRCLPTEADVRPVAAKRLLQQREEAAPFAVVERVAPRHLRRELPHQPLLRGDAILGEHQVLHPPVALARLAPRAPPPPPLLPGEALAGEHRVFPPPVALARLAPREPAPLEGVGDARDERRV